MITVPALAAGFQAVPPEGVNLKPHPEEDSDQVLGIDSEGRYYLNKQAIRNEDVGEALRCHVKSQDRFDEIGHAGLAEALEGRAAAFCDLGRYPEALGLAGDALRRVRQSDEPRIEAQVLNTLASIYERLGEHGRAGHHHEQALRVARRSSWCYAEACALAGLAVARLRVGDATRAAAYAADALALTRRTDLRIVEARALTITAGIRLAQGHRAEAVPAVEQALDICRETGHRPGEARALVVLGYAVAGISARERWRRAYEMFTGMGMAEARDVRALL